MPAQTGANAATLEGRLKFGKPANSPLLQALAERSEATRSSSGRRPHSS